MKVKINAKQPNSKMCFVCGVNNAFGLQSRFFELENHDLLALFKPTQEHQGYPGRLHGGMAAAILDETIGRAIMIKYSHDIWGVTIDFSMRLKKPIPLQEEIRVLGRVTNDSKRIFEGSGEIILADGTHAVEATGKYLKMDINKITKADFIDEAWVVMNEAEDPTSIELQ